MIIFLWTALSAFELHFVSQQVSWKLLSINIRLINWWQFGVEFFLIPKSNSSLCGTRSTIVLWLFSVIHHFTRSIRISWCTFWQGCALVSLSHESVTSWPDSTCTSEPEAIAALLVSKTSQKKEDHGGGGFSSSPQSPSPETNLSSACCYHQFEGQLLDYPTRSLA